jgi:GrpB-like predicted nucleotidyltransferase (UPF0157 family)
MLGTTYGMVEIVAYQPHWPACYEREKAVLQDVLSEDVVGMEHVGSTSIEGMDAKPTLDILAGVRELKSADYYLERLAELGYQFRPRHLVPERLHFAKISQGLRTHNLSLTVHRSEFWENHLLFRDYLRNHPDAGVAYAHLKRALSQEFPDDTVRYTQGKDRFIDGLLRKARLWRK